MMETLERVFAPTHILHGVQVMRNPDFKFRVTSPKIMWVDEKGNVLPSGIGHKAIPIEVGLLSPAVMEARGEEFGVSFGAVGESIPAEWFLANYAKSHAQKGVMVTREAAAAALRACAWPDSSAPCGHAGNSNDDDATFVDYDRAGNCIVKLFMRGKGYFKVRIPKAMFLEIVDE